MKCTSGKIEAEQYWKHHIPEKRTREITQAILCHKDKTALEIFGDIDVVRVRSCMTMFVFFSPNDILGEIIDSFYNGERCEITLKVMQQK